MNVIKQDYRIVAVYVEPCDTIKEVAAYSGMTIDSLINVINELVNKSRNSAEMEVEHE